MATRRQPVRPSTASAETSLVKLFDLLVLTPEQVERVAEFEHQIACFTPAPEALVWFTTDGTETAEDLEQEIRKIKYEQLYLGAVFEEAARVIDPLKEDFKKILSLVWYAWRIGQDSVRACEANGDLPDPPPPDEVE